jgi:threonine dehydrogenase-like Zn-dependent dehydrogenase
VLINGISGTLGLGVALFALALGARKVLGTGRDRDLLARVRAIAPGRIEVHGLDDEVSVGEWTRSLTGGAGADLVIDALGPGAPHETMLAAVDALARGGHHVNIGAVAGDVPVHLHKVMDNDMRLSGSAWFTTAEGQEMADLAESGTVDLSVFEHEVFKLNDINTALAVLKNRNAGFSNYVICPRPDLFLAGPGLYSPPCGGDHRQSSASLTPGSTAPVPRPSGPAPC